MSGSIASELALSQATWSWTSGESLGVWKMPVPRSPDAAAWRVAGEDEFDPALEREPEGVGWGVVVRIVSFPCVRGLSPL